MENIFLFESEDHQFSLVEGTSDGDRHFYIRGKFATINAVNVNKRIYSRELWEREVAKYQAEIENGSINTLMEWEHPQGRLKVDPKNAVAKITKLWIEGDYVMGEAVIFDNPQAETIKSMIRHGVKISVSSRASGSVGSGGIVKEFNLITFDIVTSPSDRAATMGGVFESEEANQNEDDKMADEALMENLVSILRTKNTEIRDLNEEIELLRDQLSKLDTLGVGSTDRAYSDDGDRGFGPADDATDRYAEEETEFTLRRVYVGYQDHGGHRHQDVNFTLKDNDPSGYYSSGEREEPRIRKVLSSNGDRAEYIGRFLGGDVNSNPDDRDGYSGAVNEAISPSAVNGYIKEVSKLSKVKIHDGESKAKFLVDSDKDLKKLYDFLDDKMEIINNLDLLDLDLDKSKGELWIVVGEEDSNNKQGITINVKMNESRTPPVTGNRFLMVPSHLL